MRAVILATSAVAALAACKADLPDLKTTGRYVRWGAVPSRAVACEGLAERADVYIERAHEALGLELPDEIIAHYYYDPDGTLMEDCDHLDGCTVTPDHPANRSGDVIEIYARRPLMYHELGHAIHLSHFELPAHPLLAESFAEVLDSDDGGDSWRARDGLSAPFADLVDSKEFEQSDALLLADATLTRHGPAAFAEFFGDAVDATEAADLDAIHEAVTGETWSTAAAAHGPNGCDTELAQCSGTVLPPQDGVWAVNTTAACDDPGGVIGPMDDRENPVMELRSTVELPTDGEYMLTKDVGIEVLLVPCDMPCGPDRVDTLVLASQASSVADLHAGRWEMVVMFFEGSPPGAVELKAM